MTRASFFASMTAIASLLCACAPEIALSPPAADEPDEPTNAAGAPSGDRNADAKQEPQPKSDPPLATTIGPLVRPRNTSSASRWIVVDAQGTPIDFEIGAPPLQLNGYGAYWCGGPTYNHNDPMKRVVKVGPGEVADTYWRAISVTREGDCWRGTPLGPGTYPTKACFYESEPNDTSALTCIETSLTITGPGDPAEIAF